MIEADLVPYAIEKGVHDGSEGLPYASPLIWGIASEVDAAYCSAYWNSIAYVTNPLAEIDR
jgi:hypothetical protein